MPTKKKQAARRKKTAGKKTAGKAAGRKSEAKSDIAVKTTTPATSLEARLLAPLAEIEQLLKQMRAGEWFQPLNLDWPKRPNLPSFFETRFPKIDVVNRDKEIVVKAEVPGIDKEDLDVTVTDRTLTIKGQSRHEEESEEDDMYRREIRSGSFSRTVTLPEDVDGRKAKASYKDGMVELHLPKVRRSKKHSIKPD